MHHRAVIAGVIAASLGGVASGQSLSPPTRPETDLPRQLNDAWRDFMDQVKPGIDETLDMIEGFGLIDDLGNYHAPERLPNGDILMRRRDDAPAIAPSEPPSMPQPTPRPAEPGAADPVIKT